MLSARLFPTLPAPEAFHALLPTPRIDLRTGIVAAGVVAGAPQTPSPDWLDDLAAARVLWLEHGQNAPLSAAAPRASLADADCAGALDAGLRAAGFAMRTVTLEVEELDVVDLGAGALAALTRLRARGWGVALRLAPGGPLPLGGPYRGVFTEVLAPAPANLSPLLTAMLGGEAACMEAQRVLAASGMEAPVTATGVRSRAEAALLIAAGYDRGQGPGV